jgi:CRP-like cAMP-binding protein
MVGTSAAQIAEEPDYMEAFLPSLEEAGNAADYPRTARIYSQGDRSDTVLYICKGIVKLSVVSRTGKEAIVGILGRGEFFGEGILAGQPLRLTSATAITTSKILSVPRRKMIHLLHKHHEVSDRFIAYILARNRRLEADLVDQLLNQVERRLARALLLLGGYGKPDGSHRVLPGISQDVLSEIVGTTRPRVNVFMTKFKKLGFIDYNHRGLLEVRDSLSGVLRDPPAHESLSASSGRHEQVLS